MAAATSKAVVVSPRLTVEQTYASAQLAKGLGASLHYLAGDAAEAAGNTKIAGEANLALLKRLGATPFAATVDCVVSVGSGISKGQAGKASIIAMATPGTTPEADHLLSLADPLSIDGAMLNRDGDLAILKGSIQNPEDKFGLSSIAALAENSDLSDLGLVRDALASEVKELGAITKLNGTRLVNTEMAPALSGIAPDARELAFRGHMIGLGLS